VGQVDWGPVAAWAGAGATALAAIVSLLVAFRWPDTFRRSRIRITFEDREPWCKTTDPESGARAFYKAFWVRMGVENMGIEPARGCVGRLIGLATDGEIRRDIDPIQLRWAGVPRSQSFQPIDIRRNQREYLNVLMLLASGQLKIVTFEDPDFDPGFDTELALDREHALRIGIYSDNSETRTLDLVVRASSDGEAIELRTG
jgi:hypothetical protein